MKTKLLVSDIKDIICILDRYKYMVCEYDGDHWKKERDLAYDLQDKLMNIIYTSNKGE